MKSQTPSLTPKSLFPAPRQSLLQVSWGKKMTVFEFPNLVSKIAEGQIAPTIM